MKFYPSLSVNCPLALYTMTDGVHGRKEKCTHSKGSFIKHSQRKKGIKGEFEGKIMYVYIALCESNINI